jgi:2-polyprenyl-3-methyl-5-hydroxy-6-metoxy-1,4-benzoquinol methylase
MRDAVPAASPVLSTAYTEQYYLTAVEGHREFRETNGHTLSPRLERALKLARLRPGSRVLDIACGRGEVVLQSALRGARAFGIDYAEAAMRLAARSMRGSGTSARAGLGMMDATALAFRPGTFDVALMLDFVEHVHQPQLEAAFDEVHRALKPGGRLIIHTSPNRLFEEVIWPRYVIKVHGFVLDAGKKWLGLGEGLFLNEIMLPLDPDPAKGDYERTLHVNPQWPGELRRTLRAHNFRVRKLDFADPARGPFFNRRLYWHNVLVKLLDAARFLRPASRLPPLDRLFSNHIWVVAERP